MIVLADSTGADPTDSDPLSSDAPRFAGFVEALWCPATGDEVTDEAAMVERMSFLLACGRV